jgi:penicillin-binding protein 1A
VTGPTQAARYERVEVVNPSDGGFWSWLVKLYAFGLMILLGILGLAGAGTYAYFAGRLPPLPDLDRYAHTAAVITRLRAWDGTPLAEWASERREIVPFDKIPPRLVEAFLAIEDRRFYEHGGLDWRGIARAALANLRAGRVSQGASTITQQVARSFFPADLFMSRSFLRKIPEAILARRLEARFAKHEILTLYLNQIFLGQTAYGVGAAARRYFDKPLGELDLGEMATLAGIARAPSRFEPLGHPEASRRRRDQVLDAMVAAGTLTAGDATAQKARPIVTRTPPDFFRDGSPYFAEHVRRDVARRLGDKALWQEGLAIETTVLPWMDVAAQENVDFSLRKLDKRQGWRGPLARLDAAAAETFRKALAERYGGEPPAVGRVYVGLVEATSAAGAKVRVGERVYDLPVANLLWTTPFSLRDSTNGRVLEPQAAAGALRRGDVIWVANAAVPERRRFADWTYDEKNEVAYLPAISASSTNGKAQAKPVQLRLEQTPRVQGALYAYDHTTGYVLSMVGGHEFDRSEFNRATQACRQPGSTYKPIYYSLALEQGYGFTSLLNDIPRAEVDPITGEVWIPRNLNDTVEYQVTLEYALVWSKNVPSVQLFKLAGAKEVEAWARRLGFTTPIIADQALALGASCTRLDELTRAFSAFAGNGVMREPVYVRRVRDRHGRVLEDRSAPGDPMGAPSERLDRLVALAAEPEPTPVIPPRTAWLTSQLLRKVVTRGHAPALRSTGMPVAGKTGTSSATMDTWFVGYTPRWMVTSWIGDDRRERPLGFKDAAFMLTVPMAARWLWEVTGGDTHGEIPWQRPPGVKANDTGGTLRTTMDEVKAEAAKHEASKDTLKKKS